jgi:hypothetical protein
MEIISPVYLINKCIGKDYSGSKDKYLEYKSIPRISVLVCRSLLVLLSFLVRPLYCLSFDLRLLITPWFLQTLVIKFVSDLRQVGGFLRILRFPPPIKPGNTTKNRGRGEIRCSGTVLNSSWLYRCKMYWSIPFLDNDLSWTKHNYLRH